MDYFLSVLYNRKDLYTADPFPKILKQKNTYMYVPELLKNK